MLAGGVGLTTRREHLDNLQMVAQVMAKLRRILEKGGKVVEQLEFFVELPFEDLDAKSLELFEHEVVDRAEQDKVGHEKEDAHEQNAHDKQRVPRGGRSNAYKRNQQEGNLEQVKPYKVLRSLTGIALHFGGQPPALGATEQHEQYIEQNQMEA